MYACKMSDTLRNASTVTVALQLFIALSWHYKKWLWFGWLACE